MMDNTKKQQTRQWIDRIIRRCRDGDRVNFVQKTQIYPTVLEVASRYVRRWYGYKVAIKTKDLTGYTIGTIRSIDITIYKGKYGKKKN